MGWGGGLWSVQSHLVLIGWGVHPWSVQFGVGRGSLECAKPPSSYRVGCAPRGCAPPASPYGVGCAPPVCARPAPWCRMGTLRSIFCHPAPKARDMHPWDHPLPPTPRSTRCSSLRRAPPASPGAHGAGGGSRGPARGAGQGLGRDVPEQEAPLEAAGGRWQNPSPIFLPVPRADTALQRASPGRSWPDAHSSRGWGGTPSAPPALPNPCPGSAPPHCWFLFLANWRTTLSYSVSPSHSLPCATKGCRSGTARLGTA